MLPSIMLATPGTEFCIRGCVCLFGIAQRCLQVLMAEPLPNRREADPAIHQFGRMRVTELMECARDSGVGTIPVMASTLIRRGYPLDA